MLTSVYKMKQVLAFVDKINQVAEGDVGSGKAGLSFSSSLCMTLARYLGKDLSWQRYLGKDQNEISLHASYPEPDPVAGWLLPASSFLPSIPGLTR